MSELLVLPDDVSDFVKRAHAFANAAHEKKGQRRKYTGLPYITHPLEVMLLVRSVPHDEAMLAASFLHDTEEDTDVTRADLEREFGSDVARLVGWVTNVSRKEDGNRAARKRLDHRHLSLAPPRAKTIKLSDVVSNIRSIVEHDPKFALVYVPEKRALLDVLTDGDPVLWSLADQTIKNATLALARPVR